MDDYELFPQGSRFPRVPGFPGDVVEENKSGLPNSVLPAEGELGDYRILRLIHEGRTASVYEVRSRFDGRSYALKTPGDPASLKACESLRIEREFAGRLRHPSLLGLQGQGEAGGVPYFLMALYSGETAGDLLRNSSDLRNTASLIDLAARFASVVDAVSALHRSGVVHRDIHPENILLDPEGRLVLADLGSALKLAERNLEPEIAPAGSLLYRSPEQLPAGANQYVPSGDVYALGMTLYILLTGCLPFLPSSYSELGRLKLTRELPSACAKNPAVPLGLDAIVRQATAIQRSARYPGAEDMARDLKRFVSRRRRCRSRYAS